MEIRRHTRTARRNPLSYSRGGLDSLKLPKGGDLYNLDGLKCIIDPERDCIGKAAALKLESRIENLERWQQDSKKFHNAFYDWQREQIAREAKLDE